MASENHTARSVDIQFIDETSQAGCRGVEVDEVDPLVNSEDGRVYQAQLPTSDAKLVLSCSEDFGSRIVRYAIVGDLTTAIAFKVVILFLGYSHKGGNGTTVAVFRANDDNAMRSERTN
jgi:hypothetical protein